MTEIKIETEGAGRVKIANDVIAVIAGTAASEIKGVAGMAGNIPGDIVEKLGHRNLGKGVHVETTEGSVKVTIHILAKFGYKLQEISEAVQKRAKSAIENMIGLNVKEVNVNIAGVIYYEENIPKKNSKNKPKRNEP